MFPSAFEHTITTLLCVIHNHHFSFAIKWPKRDGAGEKCGFLQERTNTVTETKMVEKQQMPRDDKRLAFVFHPDIILDVAQRVRRK